MKSILNKIILSTKLLFDKHQKLSQKLSEAMLTAQEYSEIETTLNNLFLSQITEYIIKPRIGVWEYTNSHVIQLYPINDGTIHKIDWGDGTIEDYSTKSGQFLHIYPEQKEYTIKIYGSNERMRLGSFIFYDAMDELFFARNIVDIISISKYLKSYNQIFENLLVISSEYYHIFNQNSKFNFQIPKYITDCSWIFQTTRGKQHIITKLINQKNYKLPDHVQNWSSAFNLWGANINVTHLFDQWKSGKKDVTYMFGGGIALSGTLPADKLWNNKNIEWISTKGCFCNYTDLTNVTNANEIPDSWK